MTITIYHNPACGTSRAVLALMQENGEEPQVVEYLKQPLNRQELAALLKQLHIPARALLREKGELYAELKLDDLTLSEETLIDAMATHPILMNRPVVITEKGAKLCRPAETVRELL